MLTFLEVVVEVGLASGLEREGDRLQAVVDLVERFFVFSGVFLHFMFFLLCFFSIFVCYVQREGFLVP